MVQLGRPQTSWQRDDVELAGQLVRHLLDADGVPLVVLGDRDETGADIYNGALDNAVPMPQALALAKAFSQLLDRIVEDVKDNPNVRIELDAEARERLLRAAAGQLPGRGPKRGRARVRTGALAAGDRLGSVSW